MEVEHNKDVIKKISNSHLKLAPIFAARTTPKKQIIRKQRFNKIET